MKKLPRPGIASRISLISSNGDLTARSIETQHRAKFNCNLGKMGSTSTKPKVPLVLGQ